MNKNQWVFPIGGLLWTSTHFITSGMSALQGSVSTTDEAWKYHLSDKVAGTAALKLKGNWKKQSTFQSVGSNLTLPYAPPRALHDFARNPLFVIEITEQYQVLCIVNAEQNLAISIDELLTQY